MSEWSATSPSSLEQPENHNRHLADTGTVRAREMEMCIACGSRLVHPVSWEETRDGFQVLLRCPECLIHLQDEFSDAELARYDAVLEDGTRAVLADLERFARANMTDYVRRFTSALQAGQIQAEDF